MEAIETNNDDLESVFSCKYGYSGDLYILNFAGTLARDGPCLGFDSSKWTTPKLYTFEFLIHPWFDAFECRKWKYSTYFHPGMGLILVQSASFSQRFGSPPTFPPKRSWSIYRSDLNNIILLVSQNSWFNWKKHNPDQQINQLEDIPYKELELKNYSSRINKLKKHTTPWKIQWISRWSGQRSGVLPPILPVPSPPGSPSSALAMKQGGWRQLPSVYITLLATNMSPPSRHFWVWWTSKSGRWTNRSLEGCNLLLLVSATRPSIISLQNVTQNCKNQIWFPKKTNNLTFF